MTTAPETTTPTPEQLAKKAADAVKARIDALASGKQVSLQQIAELRSNLEQVIKGYDRSLFTKHGASTTATQGTRA